jgi:Metal-sensitive transcriptional repressor
LEAVGLRPRQVRGVQHGLECGIHMAHTLEEKKRLLNRVRRIMGQVAAIEKTQEGECAEVLHNISACRGAMDALMAEVIRRSYSVPHPAWERWRN